MNAANTAPLNVPYKTPDPAKYATYCATAVAHFTPLGVRVYELWNEPNLTTSASVSGWAWQLAAGFAGLAVAAYPAMKAADPGCLVLSGTAATASEFGTAGNPRACTWPQVVGGATTATITSTAATANEAPGFLSGAPWPTGTAVTAVTPGVSYTVTPPPWTTGGFPAIPAGSGTVRVQNTQLAPDFFIDRVYDAAAGRPWCDAIAVHPYTQPVKPSTQLAQFGGWAVIPNIRATMAAHGDAAKRIWITEVGAPTGAAAGCSWPAAAATATTLPITGPASAADLGYQITAPGLPTGCFVTAATGTQWTVTPPTGLTLSAAIPAGAAASSITVAATPGGPRTIPAGAVLTVQPPVTSGNWVPAGQQVTTTAAVTTSTTATRAVPITPATPTYTYAAGSPVTGSIGQTFGVAVPAGAGATVTLAAQGVPFVFGLVDEATQAAIITESFRAVVRGVAAGAGVVGAPAWPYVHGTPVFVYCWADSNAGMFGLERVDGTLKPAVAAVRNIAQLGA
jgi:hypothetical protein